MNTLQRVWQKYFDRNASSSKLKESADDNFNFDEYCREFSDWIENTVGKGEIDRYEQFLLFPQCFQKTCTADTLKPGLVWKRVRRQTSSEIGFYNRNYSEIQSVSSWFYEEAEIKI